MDFTGQFSKGQKLKQLELSKADWEAKWQQVLHRAKLLKFTQIRVSDQVYPVALAEKTAAFTGTPRPVCNHNHKLLGSGAVFYQSVGLMQCSICYGWQDIRKPIQ